MLKGLNISPCSTFGTMNKITEDIHFAAGIPVCKLQPSMPQRSHLCCAPDACGRMLPLFFDPGIAALSKLAVDENTSLP